MYCYRCGSLNSENAPRCTHCGTELSVYASHTEDDVHQLRQNLMTAQEAIKQLSRFIPAVIVESILHDQARLRGERREMAVLFTDAVGFTHLSASLDAESAFNLINDLLGRLVPCVHRYGGLVDKFTGDGLIAVFGAPIAHENNAEMAIRAALDIQRAAAQFAPIARAQLGAPLQMRIGIHSGPAIAGILGTSEQAAYTVIGETVNLAARLETQATPGNILVSTRVHAQTQSLFTFREMEAISIKGVDQPIKTYEVIGKRTAPMPTRGVPGISSIFLGHNAELEQLRTRLKAVLETQTSQVVIVHGEAGMGKSRLIAEWLTAITPDTFSVLRGHGLPYVTGIGYTVFYSLLQNAINAYPPSFQWDHQISAALLPFLKYVLKLPLTQREEIPFSTLAPEQIKQLTILALREWLLKEAQRHPLILVLDDFQWADDLSRDVFEVLSNLLFDAPILFCVITRSNMTTPPDSRPQPTTTSTTVEVKRV